MAKVFKNAEKGGPCVGCGISTLQQEVGGGQEAFYTCTPCAKKKEEVPEIPKPVERPATSKTRRIGRKAK
jgi:hypothetical protein